MGKQPTACALNAQAVAKTPTEDGANWNRVLLPERFTSLTSLVCAFCFRTTQLHEPRCRTIPLLFSLVHRVFEPGKIPSIVLNPGERWCPQKLAVTSHQPHQ